MKTLLEEYSMASQAPTSLARDVYLISSDIGNLVGDEFDAVVSVKRGLKERNFEYSPFDFTLQEVMSKRRGNCLGLPLLVGSLLELQGRKPRFSIIVNPKDFIYEEELRFYQNLINEARYDSPELASFHQDTTFYRFAPLEHLVLNTSRGAVEITSEKDLFPGSESSRDLTPSEAASLVYKDRAIIAGINGNLDLTKWLLRESVTKWSANRQAHAILAKISLLEGDAQEAHSQIEQFEQLDGSDSYFYFQRYLLAGDRGYLETALAIYPPYAEAIAIKARTLTESDKGEARFLYSIASQLYSRSCVLDYEAFLLNNAIELRELYGLSKVKKILETERDK